MAPWQFSDDDKPLLKIQMTLCLAGTRAFAFAMITTTLTNHILTGPNGLRSFSDVCTPE